MVYQIISLKKELSNLANYFDYERYEHDIKLEQGGTFYSCGYVYHTGERFSFDYDGNRVPDGFSVLTNPVT